VCKRPNAYQAMVHATAMFHGSCRELKPRSGLGRVFQNGEWAGTKVREGSRPWTTNQQIQLLGFELPFVTIVVRDLTCHKM
jgi:hypothetical protein